MTTVGGLKNTAYVLGSYPDDVIVVGVYSQAEDRDGIAGYGYLMSGRIGHWLHILVNSHAYDRASDLLDYGLALLNYYPPLPTYCGVREYQGGVRAPLEDRGFEAFSTQCLLVKHTMARVKNPARSLVPALEKRVEAPTTTVSPTERT